MNASGCSRRLILASASPRRRRLLEAAGFAPLVRPVALREVAPADAPDPWVGVRENARRKAEAAWERASPGAVVVAADTIVVVDGTWIGKPASRAEARELLARLGGRAHEVATAVELRAEDLGESFVDVSRVVLKRLTGDQIDAYHAAVEPLDRAGAYDIDHPGPIPGGVVASFEGSYTNIMGLPMERLAPLLGRALGSPPAPA